ncbi:hypothetical protein ACOMHN_018471 [Nucella lapillus]
MADSGTGQSKGLISIYSHVAIMAALMIISLGTVVRCDKKEVPSSPGSSFEFDDIDADNSGCVEGPEEMQNFRIQVGRILGEALHLDSIERALRAGRITHSADVNGDGRICQCDLLSILLTESTGPGVHRHAFRVYEDGSFFDDVDTDDDGVLDDVTEKAALTQKLAQCVSEDQAKIVVDAMSKLDKDDGKLTRAEYLLFLKLSQHQREAASDKSSHLPSSQPMPPQAPPQPQSLPQQPQPMPQAIPQSQPQTSPQNHLQKTSEKGTNGETQPEQDQGRPRKRVLPQPLPGNPLQPPQPASQPAQPWSQPQPHFQLMRQAGQSIKAGNLAGQPLNQPAQPSGAEDQDEQSLRAIAPRRQQVNAKRIMTQFRYQPKSAFSRGGPQVQQIPKRLENVYPNLQPGLQPDLTKLEQAAARNQLGQPRPVHPQPQPGQPQPKESATRLQADLLNWQPKDSNPNPIQSKPDTNQPEKANQETKTFSDQLEDLKPKLPPSPPQAQFVDKNLESELQKKKN